MAWLPIALLLAGVANHLWQVHHHQLSPWLGAGFGMFASTDLDSARQVYLQVLLEDGSEREIALAEPYQDTLQRARALPTEAWLERLAEAAFNALQASPELEFSPAPVALRKALSKTGISTTRCRRIRPEENSEIPRPG